MTYGKILFTLGFALLTSACGKVTGLDQNGTGKLNQDQVEKATSRFCASNQQLKELSIGSDMLFSQLNYNTSLFAFSGPTDSNGCIISQAINDSLQNGLWFSINPIDNCLKDGTIWEARQAYDSGVGRNYVLVQIGDGYQRIMNMNGHQGLAASYVQQRVGLKLLQCTN